MSQLKTLYSCKYSIIIDSCGIDDEGVKHIIKGRWPKLKYLWLGTSSKIYTAHNNIGIDGYLDICGANWNNIQWALLCSGKTVGIMGMIACSKWGISQMQYIRGELNSIESDLFLNDLELLMEKRSRIVNE